jgi:hypothetical protein
MPDSYTPLWKQMYEKALRESDTEKLTALVNAAEEALVLRYKELRNDADHDKEWHEIEAAKADLLVIKIHKLGWPKVPISNAGAWF